ncbi:hypothetical protein O0I10_007183 [Lichtheimia ornata]|uniref:DH domain-containing protein n=1 Tax=Lichtheimia ornata TaxID=688661 RepID=A0AAD7V1V2_9FUNG|nr:uncharacterized protein O0I10_007183 [Lichtheimia ornata]KAJ8657103.1 hypothetical protein O0I10_007183 [Lichtheimia ornata]
MDNDMSKEIHSFVNEHLMASWLSTESSFTEDLFDTVIVQAPSKTSTDADYDDELAPLQQNKKKGRLRTKLSIASMMNNNNNNSSTNNRSIPASSSTCSIAHSITSSIGSSSSPTTTSPKRVMSSFRRVKSFHRLREHINNKKTTLATSPSNVSSVSPMSPPPAYQYQRRPHSALYYSATDHDDSVSTSSSSCFSHCGGINSSITTTTVGKLSHVIQELVETEKAYYQDIQLIHDIYMFPETPSPFTEHEHKLLFGNITAILDLEKELVPLLCNDENNIGQVFMQMMDRIEQVYCTYCKRHQDVINALNHAQQTRAEVQSFLKSCYKAMQGRTTSWDLPSLLIKPVQRVLKYPLLLQEMANLASPTDPDLEAAAADIQRVADYINEMKRRKDMAEMILTGKPDQTSQMVHGINKTIARRAYRLKKAVGKKGNSNNGDKASTMAQDAIFDTLYQRFEYQQQVGHQLADRLMAWVDMVKALCAQTHTFAVSMEDFYGPWGPIQEFSKVTFDCIAEELERQAQELVSTRLNTYHRLFDRPAQVIAKRARKVVDHERAESSVDDEAYMAIHTQLVEELPSFLALAAEYFDIVMNEVRIMQAETYQRLWQEWLRLATMLPANGENGGNQSSHTPPTTRDIINEYQSRMLPLHECMENICAITQSKQSPLSSRRVSSSSSNHNPSSEEDDLMTWDEMLKASSLPRKRDSGVDEKLGGDNNKGHDPTTDDGSPLEANQLRMAK